MVSIRQIAIVVVAAGLPLPLLLFAGLAPRQDLFWFFLSNLAVAVIAVLGVRRGGSAPARRRWSFEPDADR